MRAFVEGGQQSHGISHGQDGQCGCSTRGRRGHHGRLGRGTARRITITPSGTATAAFAANATSADRAG